MFLESSVRWARLDLADLADAVPPAAHYSVGCGEYSVGGEAELADPNLYWPNLAVTEIEMRLLWLYQSFLYLLLHLPGALVQLAHVPHLEQLFGLLYLTGALVQLALVRVSTGTGQCVHTLWFLL